MKQYLLLFFIVNEVDTSRTYNLFKLRKYRNLIKCPPPLIQLKNCRTADLASYNERDQLVA